MKKEFYFLFFLISLISKGIKKVEIFKKDIIFFLDKEFLLFLFFFFKNHTNFQLKSIIDITCIDYPKKLKRFEIVYNFLSIFFSYRIRFKVNLVDFESIPSLSFLFKGANWLEREVWDMYGIFFFNHSDLRRILTDYGFEGFPLRKDFPLSGFIEVRYDDERKSIVYEDISLAQEYRQFSFSNPWEFLVNKV